MYHNLTSKVKWKDGIGENFPIQQGVRQGGILSTHLYKLYINDLLKILEENNLGQFIGENYAGCPTCADDILLLSSSEEEMQIMLNTAKSYSDNHRYKIHPTKSVTITKSTKSTVSIPNNIFHLDQIPLPPADQGTHLGVIRAKKEPK